MSILDSKLYRGLDRFTNIFLLNLIWLLSSLPLITIFPATVAMFSVFKDWTEGKERNLIKSFFRYFKKYFKHSFLYGILWFSILIILYIDLTIINELESYNFIMTSFLFLLIILVAFNTVYIIPITTMQFELKFIQKIKNSFLFSIMFFPTTLLCIIIGVSVAIIVVYMPPLMFIVFSPAAFLVFRLCYRTFNKLDKKSKT